MSEIEAGVLLEMNPIWDSLTEAEKQEIREQASITCYKKNEVIHTDGQKPTHIMLLISGKVRIFKEGAGMRPQIIRLLKPGDAFSYRAIIAGGTYNASASAFEPCVVGKVPCGMFMHLLQTNPTFCYQVMLMMARDLAISELQTVNLTQKHLRGRLAESLLTLLENYGLDEDGVTIGVYMSREDLANMSNMTTANAIRTLSQFAQDGLIAVDGRKIRILDEEEMRHISRVG